MKNQYRFVLAAVILSLASAFWSGCATTAMGSKPQTSIYVSSKDLLFIAFPVLPDSVDTLLSQLGWGGGRFTEELRKELVYQFNQKGTGTTEDSSKAKSMLFLQVKEYTKGRGGTYPYSGEVWLKTATGERRFLFGKSSQRAQSIERSDPTIDNIRRIAEAIVKDAQKSPVSRRPRKSEENPPLLMLF